MSIYRRGVALIAAIAPMACASSSPGPPPLPPARAVETFDAAWRIVHETHFDTTFNGVDWPAVRDTLRPRAAVAESLSELRQIIRSMLDRLGQSHFALIPREAADTLDPTASDVEGAIGDVGFDVRLIDDEVVVTTVDSAGPAEGAGVQPGWIVEQIGEDPVDSLLQAVRQTESRYSSALRIWSRVTARLQGSPGASRRLQFRDGTGTERTVDLTLRPDISEPVKFGNLPTFFARFSREQVDSEEYGVSVGRLWFNFWMVPLTRQVDRAIDAFRDLDGIVVDLRGNRGGVGAMVAGVAGHFLDDRISLGTFRTRTTVLKIAANPRRVDTRGQRVHPFGGPVAVLIDEVSGSASELFAGGMQSLGRVRVFGTTSIGGVLPARTARLPNDDILYYAFAEFTTADGTRLEGRGVIPDEAVASAREDLVAGRDRVLEAALQWIAAEQLESDSPSPNSGR